jgi:cytochrome c oxidase subunit 2
MIRRTLAGASLAALMAVGLAACGNSGGTATTGGGGGQAYPGNGNAANGQTLFLGTGGCVVCHTVTGTAAAAKLGPDLTHVGTLLTADQIYTQVADPKQRPAPYAPPIQAGTVMTTNSLSAQQRADITAWLSSLK